jgi:dCMP deaminase
MSDLILYLDSFNADNGRLTWDGYFTAMAKLTSLRSPSTKLKVGAVIVHNNRVIATGYNGFFPGVPHKSIEVNGHEVNTVHAEQNAIADAAKRGIAICGSTIYVTHYPCINCAKMIIASGIDHVKYLSDYKNDPIVGDMFNQLNINVTMITKEEMTDQGDMSAI